MISYEEIAPGIMIIDNVLPDAQHYIDVALQQDDWDQSTVGIYREHDDEIRTSSGLHLEVAYNRPVEWH